MFGPFHSSRFFWKVFVCLPPSHSLCTAFRKTRSALPRDVSGVRSANPYLPSQGRSGWLPFSSCVSAVGSRSEAAPFPGSSSSDLPLLKLGVPAGRRDRQVFLGVLFAPAVVTASLEPGESGCEGQTAAGSVERGWLPSLVMPGVGTDIYLSRVCLLLSHDPWCIILVRLTGWLGAAGHQPCPVDMQWGMGVCTLQTHSSLLASSSYQFSVFPCLSKECCTLLQRWDKALLRAQWFSLLSSVFFCFSLILLEAVLVRSRWSHVDLSPEI